ncbi:AraC family transcriptional regulator [Paenibacillus sp. tmac-D7]|uniref:helix-turn-helix domain-containing protein n=1 Tax=Paenibacillus sp. tmac-D7 TaxID=2591462 RepID=UPI0011445F82|nr:AraC family transcriptional regulator [Paenibacillus sp. tmac-D7]
MSQSGQSMLVEALEFLSAKRMDGNDPWPQISEPCADVTSLVFIKGGRGESVIENVTYSVREGDIVICHPLVPFQLRSSADHPLMIIYCTFSIHVSGKNKGQLLDAGQCPVVPLRNNLRAMGNYFEAIVHEYEHPSAGSREIVNSLMKTITIVLIRMLEAMKVPEYTSITQTVKEYIQSHFEQELTLNDLAELVYVSPYHLVHTFKNDVGMAPIQYLIHCRIEEAKRLLRSTELSVSDISFRVGYPNSNYFNQIFKKMAGVTPGKYRSDARR